MREFYRSSYVHTLIDLMLADKFSGFCRKHIAALRAAETALILALATSAWAASETFIAAPLLILAIFFSWAALYATNLPAERRLLASSVVTAILIVEGISLLIQFQNIQ
jgi:hypothetical protein